MRHIRGIIALFSLTLVWHTQVDAQSHETATGTRDDTLGAASAVPRTAKDKSFDPSTVAKSIVDEASRLKSDAAEWGEIAGSRSRSQEQPERRWRCEGRRPVPRSLANGG